MKQLLTIQELADLSAESKSVWRKRIRRGEIPVIRLGRNIRIRPENYDSFLAERAEPAQQYEGAL